MLSGLLRDVITANPDRFRRARDAVTCSATTTPPTDGPGSTPAVHGGVLNFLRPEGFTYEYSFGVRRIVGAAASVPRHFDAEEVDA